MNRRAFLQAAFGAVALYGAGADCKSVGPNGSHGVRFPDAPPKPDWVEKFKAPIADEAPPFDSISWTGIMTYGVINPDAEILVEVA